MAIMRDNVKANNVAVHSVSGTEQIIRQLSLNAVGVCQLLVAWVYLSYQEIFAVSQTIYPIIQFPGQVV